MSLLQLFFQGLYLHEKFEGTRLSYIGDDKLSSEISGIGIAFPR